MQNVRKRAELSPSETYSWVPETSEGIEGRWYAVRTRSNYEYKIAEDLRSKAIHHYIPGAIQTKQWKDRRKQMFVPLFPGYVFTRFTDTPLNRLNVLKTNGVVRFLGCGLNLEDIPDQQIESLRRLLSSRALCFSHPFLYDGCWVRVRRGPLAGLEGTLVRHCSSSRLVISINALSRSVATELDSADVEQIQPPRLHAKS